MNFENSLARLPGTFCSRLKPTPLHAPYLVSFNADAAHLVDFDRGEADRADFAEHVVGIRCLPGSESLAMRHAGYQFGHYVPQLGDWRATLLGAPYCGKLFILKPTLQSDAMKPYAESCEQNRDPILAVLRDIFAERRRVLEIASGTGQHAVYFGAALPHLTWQTSELPENRAGIQAWLDEAMLPNVLPPLALDVTADDWPPDSFDAIFNANTVHIVEWPAVELLFAGVGRVLSIDGCLCLYGPFNYGGAYTSESNARFDAWLKARDPSSGVRDFEAIDRLASEQGMVLAQDIAMPANNRTLVWRKVEQS